MIISLLCFNAIVSKIHVLRISFVKQYTVGTQIKLAIMQLFLAAIYFMN